MNDRTEAEGRSEGSQFSTFEPRCKVCRSPHRREIEVMLATGWPQGRVRRHWNEFLHTGGCPESRRSLSGGPPALSVRVASVTGANHV